MIEGKLSWVDDWTDAATLPTFGAIHGAAVKVPLVASARPMTGRASDPLDEMFE